MDFALRETAWGRVGWFVHSMSARSLWPFLTSDMHKSLDLVPFYTFRNHAMPPPPPPPPPIMFLALSRDEMRPCDLRFLASIIVQRPTPFPEKLTLAGGTGICNIKDE